jgi:hypothetical protein
MVKIGAAVFGIIFLVLGILGFVPGASTQLEGLPHLFGIFAHDAIHNIVHILTGIIGLLTASSDRYAKWYLQIFGIIYVLIAIAGFLQGDTVVGLFTVNMAGNILHLGLGIGLLTAGFALPVSTAMAMRSTTKPLLK